MCSPKQPDSPAVTFGLGGNPRAFMPMNVTNPAQDPVPDMGPFQNGPQGSSQMDWNEILSPEALADTSKGIVYKVSVGKTVFQWTQEELSRRKWGQADQTHAPDTLVLSYTELDQQAILKTIQADAEVTEGAEILQGDLKLTLTMEVPGVLWFSKPTERYSIFIVLGDQGIEFPILEDPGPEAGFAEFVEIVNKRNRIRGYPQPWTDSPKEAATKRPPAEIMSNITSRDVGIGAGQIYQGVAKFLNRAHYSPKDLEVTSKGLVIAPNATKDLTVSYQVPESLISAVKEAIATGPEHEANQIAANHLTGMAIPADVILLGCVFMKALLRGDTPDVCLSANRLHEMEGNGNKPAAFKRNRELQIHRALVVWGNLRFRGTIPRSGKALKHEGPLLYYDGPSLEMEPLPHMEGLSGIGFDPPRYFIVTAAPLLSVYRDNPSLAGFIGDFAALAELGTIPSHSWAKSIGIAATSIIRSHAANAIKEGGDPATRSLTRRAILEKVPTDPSHRDILASSNPIRARRYFTEASGLLIDKGTFSAVVEPGTKWPRKGWQDAWLNELVTITLGGSAARDLRDMTRPSLPAPKPKRRTKGTP